MQDVEFRKYENRIRGYLITHLNEHYSGSATATRTILTERSNAVAYRASAVQWNYNALKATLNNAIYTISLQKTRDDIYPAAINHLFPISFNFDDVIFNLISLIDYSASLITMIITENTSKIMKWNSLQQTLRNNHLGFPKTAASVKSLHSSWINKLAEYRAGVYHYSNEFSTAEHWFDFTNGTDNIEFYLPEAAVKQLPCFNKGDKVGVLIGAEKLIDDTFIKLENLLRECYLEKPKVN